MSGRKFELLAFSQKWWYVSKRAEGNLNYCFFSSVGVVSKSVSFYMDVGDVCKGIQDKVFLHHIVFLCLYSM